jgi:cellulose synthase/poly-beta-1,6-N-acetylglucosamine synthase-like glycosyltransferase
VDLLHDLLLAFEQAIVWYFFGLNSFYAVLLILSIPEIWNNWKIATSDDLERQVSSKALPPISLIVPAYNMEQTIIEAVRSHLSLRYPRQEVIVINDGSSDQTLTRLREAFDLYEIPPAIPVRLKTQHIRAYYRSRRARGLMVIDKVNGGKADALNAGLCAARYPLVVAADADTLIEPDALLRLVRPFLLGRPVVAAGGTIRVANGCDIKHARVTRARLSRTFLAAVQVPEYLRAFLFGRLGWNRLGGNLIVSGAFGLFRRDHLLEIGGYQTGHVVEDLDLVVRLHKHLRDRRVEYEIPFIPDPLAWTEVPSDLRTLGRQRDRWHRGLARTLLRHRRMLFNPKYGTVGWLMFPFFLFGELLAPVIEVTGYLFTGVALTLGVIDWQFALLFLCVAIGYQMLLSIWAVILEETTYRTYPQRRDFFRMLLYALAEPFGYRQLTVFWRLRGLVRALRGHESWGEMQRAGFHESAPEVERPAA